MSLFIKSLSDILLFDCTEKWHITLWNLNRFFLWSNRKSKRELLFFFRMEVYHDMNVEVCKYYLSPAWDIYRWRQQWSDFRSGKLRLSWVLRLKSWGLRGSDSVILSFNFDEAANLCKTSNDACNYGELGTSASRLPRCIVLLAQLG